MNAMSVRISTSPPSILVSREYVECLYVTRPTFLVRADFEGATVEAGRRQSDRHRLAARVLPIPPVDAGKRRCEAAVRTLPCRLVVRLEISLRAAIRLTVELVHDGCTRFP